MYNQSFCEESTNPTFTTFDQAFATEGLYTFTHKFFKRAFFYISSRYWPPEQIRPNVHDNSKRLQVSAEETFRDSDTTWLGQEGGLEGLRQKRWTVLLMFAILVVGFAKGIHADLVGQGDNQVLLIHFQLPDWARGRHGQKFAEEFPELVSQMVEYAIALLKIFDGIGLTLKIEETYSSMNLVNYGKDLHFRGVQLTQLLKKICRMFPESNDVHPIIDNRIASVYSAAFSASSKSVDAIVPYGMALIEHYRLVALQ